MWAKAGLFLMKHWRMVLLIILVTGGSYSVYRLYEDNKFLSGEVAKAEDALGRCETIRDNLSDRLDKVTEDLKKVEEERQRLEDEVEEADDEINEIRRQRDRLQWEIEGLEIPTDCGEKFDWMVDRFQFLEEQFYTEPTEEDDS